MTLDKNTLYMLLTLPDDPLIMIIKRLAKEKGINLGDCCRIVVVEEEEVRLCSVAS